MRARESCGALAIAVAGALALGISAILLAIPEGLEGTDMKPKLVEHKAFKVVGIAARTNNAKEASPDGVIGKQWGRFINDRLAGTIPNRADGNVVAVYTDYASNVDGDYTFVIGARVTKAENVPAGMVVKDVPAGRYAVFTSDRGPVQQVVVATWKRIWDAKKSELGGERAYKADFELYDERAQNPADSIVEIHIGTR